MSNNRWNRSLVLLFILSLLGGCGGPYSGSWMATFFGDMDGRTDPFDVDNSGNFSFVAVDLYTDGAKTPKHWTGIGSGNITDQGVLTSDLTLETVDGNQAQGNLSAQCSQSNGLGEWNITEVDEKLGGTLTLLQTN